MKKKAVPVILALTLIAGMLSGCGTGKKENINDGSAASAGEAVSKGRYAEAEIPLPGEDGAAVMDIIQTADGTFEVYTMKEKTVERFTYEHGQWKKEDLSLLEGLTFPFGFQVIYGEDHNRYVLYFDEENYQSHLCQLSEDGTKKPVMEIPLSEKRESGYYVSPDSVNVTEDGRVILSIRNSSNVYSPTGELLNSLPQDSSNSNWRTSGYLHGNELLTIGENGFLLYDLSSQDSRNAEEIPYQQEDYDSYSITASDRNGGFYMANPQGIHHRNQGGSIWETVADGSLNSLSQPSVFLRKLFVGDSKDFYIWMSTDVTNTLKHYTYDPEMPSVPSKTLTVYGLDLSLSDTIRQAASMYQLEYPEVRVELIDGKNTSGGTTVSDTIRALNTELLGGNGADVLILDGLPVNSYIEKGVLENMETQLTGLSGDQELMANVVEAFRDKNGAVYQLPARMVLPVVYGEPGAVDSLSSIADMKAYQNAASLPMRPKMIYETLLRQLIFMQYDEITDPENGKLIPGKLKELLETVEVMGKASDAKALFGEDEDGGQGIVYNMSRGMEGLDGIDYSWIDQGECSLALERIEGLNSYMLPLAVAKKHEYPIESMNHAFLPKDLMGINSTSGQKELAQDFILYALGRKVQENDLTDGIPVNVPAWDKWINSIDVKRNYSVSLSSNLNDYTITANWPEKEDVLHLFELAKAADSPVLMDSVLMEIVIDETKGYFEGNLSLEQAVQNTENKANLYFSEK